MPIYNVSATTFSPETLTGSAVELTLTDDDVSSAIPLPFTFTFFDIDYTDIYVGSNGLVGFNTANMTEFAADSIPSVATPNNAIYGFWTDLDPEPPGTTIKYETFSTTPNQIFVINYDQIQSETDPFSIATFQIKLFEVDNHIEIHTTSASNVTTGQTATQGIENEDGTIAYVFSVERNNNSGSYSLTNDAIKFVISASNEYLINTFLVGIDSAGDVQTINAGTSDDGIPIFFELETQQLDFGNRSHLKKLSDRIVVFAKDGLNSTIEAKPDNGDYKQINDLQLDERVNIGENVDLEGNYFTFKWSGEANEATPILEGFYIDSVSDQGMVER